MRSRADKKCGVYKIENRISGKKYIGCSKDIKHRFSSHLCSLRKNKHVNNYLQLSWNKYGEISFVFSVLRYCSEDELETTEEFFVKKYKSNDKRFGYNHRLFANTNRGSYHTRVHKAGDRYGRLVLIERHDNFPGGTGWLCKCDCGNEKVVAVNGVKHGAVRSCGCVRKEVTALKRKTHRSGDKYNRLTLIKFHSKQKVAYMWLCKCDCGKEVVVSASAVKTGNTKSCGCLFIETSKAKLQSVHKRHSELRMFRENLQTMAA